MNNCFIFEKYNHGVSKIYPTRKSILREKPVMKTILKIRLFRKEMKTRHPGVIMKPSDEEILEYIDMASKAFKQFTIEKQVRMAAALAADHYLSKQRL
jgi:hypothetical protein